MPKNFSLKWMLLAIALLAGLFAVVSAGQLQGLVIYLSFILAMVIFATPAEVNVGARALILLMGTGAAMIGWCLLSGCFGLQSVGSGWYRGQLDEIGGWATGIFVAAWRASCVFSKPAE
jgi:hypothetical protein